MALVEGVEVTDELREKLEIQIYKSLEDINVIALLLAAIRVEYDFSNNLIIKLMNLKNYIILMVIRWFLIICISL